MRLLREWLARLRAAVAPDRPDDDLAEELRLHLEMAAEEARRQGRDPDEAVRAARLEAGGIARSMEALRDQRGLPWLEDLARDLRYGLRVLRRSPVFAVVAIFTLALGIGANAAIFRLIDALSLRSLPVSSPEELVEIRADGIEGFGINVPNGRVTYPLWEQIRAHQRALSGVFAWGNAGLVVGRGPSAHRAEGLWVSGDFFRALGLRPARGRLLAPDDDSAACGASVAVVSHDYWQAALGGAESVVGSTLVIVNQPFTVVGVAPRGFTGLEVGRGFDVALPLCIAVQSSAEGLRRDLWWLRVMGRPAGDWSVATADAHLRSLSPGILDATLPEGYSAELLTRYRSFRFGVFPVSRGVSRLRETHSTSLSLLLGLTGLVLLITCANLATLMLARAAAREREIAMRVAMGAPRRRLVSQMVVESLLVAAAGAAAAVPIAVFSARALVGFLGTPENPVSLPVSADWRLVAFVAAATAATAVLFGLIPALRISLVDPLAATRQTSRGLTVDRHRARLRRALVAGQVALSLVLVIAAALFVRSFRNLSTVDLGFDPDRLVVTSFFDLGGFAPPERRAAFGQEMTAAVRATPGVAAAAASTHVPLEGNRWSHFFRLPDRADDDTRAARFAYVGPGYFETLGVPVLAGRDFDDHDHATSRRVLLVNDAFVRRHLGTADAVGRRVRTVAEAGYPGVTYEIVGVVGNTKYETLRDEECMCDAGQDAMPPIAYVPTAQNPSPQPFVHVIARAAGSVEALRAGLTRRFEAIDPGVGVQVVELAPRMRALLATDRAIAWLAGAFGALAVVLVVVGLYGVIAYLAVSRRTEVGIRLALGSTRARIVGLVLRDSAWLLGAGAVIGLPLAAAAMRGAEALLFGIAPTDIATLAGATVLLALAGSLAGSIPAWRAAWLPPMAAIRDEPESMWRTARVAVRRAVRELTSGNDAAVAETLTGDVAGAVHRAASFPEAVRTALETLRERAGARRILLLEKAGDEYRSPECTIPAGGVLVNRLTHFRHPLPLVPGDFKTWRRWAQELRPEHLPEIETLEGAGVCVAIPLRISRELVGVMLVGAPEGREAFTAGETQLFDGAAGVFAMLIENARLNERALEQEKVRRDLSLAAEVQQRLLPGEVPAVEIAEFAAASLPARSIGGDYYDFFEVGDRRIGIALADVSGKGIAAALIVSVVQTSLRMITSQGDISLPRLTERLNEFLYRTTPGNKYATFFCAQLDAESRQLRYVNAGHNPPLLLRGAGPGAAESGGVPEVHELAVGGAVVGMLPGLTYEEGTVDLGPGDVLLAFTDGVTEAHSPDEKEFGEERLNDLLRQVAHLPASGIAARVSEALKGWIHDAEQFDDLTFVVMKIR
jgi:predicted permease